MEKKHIIELTNKYAQYVEKKPNDKYYRQLWMLSCTAVFLKSEPNAQVLREVPSFRKKKQQKEARMMEELEAYWKRRGKRNFSKDDVDEYCGKQKKRQENWNMTKPLRKVTKQAGLKQGLQQ